MKVPTDIDLQIMWNRLLAVVEEQAQTEKPDPGGEHVDAKLGTSLEERRHADERERGQADRRGSVTSNHPQRTEGDRRAGPGPGASGVIRLRLGNAVVDQEAEIGAHREPSRVPIRCRGIVGYRDERAPHTLRPGPEHLEILRKNRTRNRQKRRHQHTTRDPSHGGELSVRPDRLPARSSPAPSPVPKP